MTVCKRADTRLQHSGRRVSHGSYSVKIWCSGDGFLISQGTLAVVSGAPIVRIVTPPTRPLWQSIKDHAVLLFGLLVLMWAIEIVDFVLPMNLDALGIRPRSERGLLGVLLSPFLHVGFGHLISNSLPFLLLGGLVMTGGRRQFLLVSVWVTIIGGAGVWLMGGGRTVHLGASLVIFGYLGFLLSRGIAERSVGGVLLSLALLFGYGGMLFGIFPGQPGISWLGHLCGFLAGIAGAFLFTRRTDPVGAMASN
jgi:membrane associated rhomboid family serine protease